jgi:hypothetical protein
MTRNVILVVVSLFAVACGSINNKVVVRDRGAVVIDRAELLARYPELDLMNDAAILSAAAYDKPEAHPTTKLADYCAATTPNVSFDPKELGWSEIEKLPQPPAPPSGERNIRDLRYRVWVKTLGDGRKIAMLAFRGTQSGADWYSNLRWVTRIIPNVQDHYEQLNEIVDDLIETIQQHEGANTTIIATGHSLGGGLAQLAGYASNRNIRTVYAFDPTIVTYFYSIDKTLREHSREGENIFRVFEQGEALSYVRWIAKRFYPVWHKDPRIVQVKFHLLSGGLVRNHSIRRFACASMSIPMPAPAKTAEVSR